MDGNLRQRSSSAHHFETADIERVTVESFHETVRLGTRLPALRGLAANGVPLMGQVPTDLMLNGTSRQVARRAAKDMREGGAQGGFVLAATCGLPPYTPAENIHALVAAAAGHGRQPPESNP